MHPYSALVVYESMFGGTEKIAHAIAHGLERSATVRVGSVEQFDGADASHVDLLVVGGPTHAHSMSVPATRAEAIAWTQDVSKQLALTPGSHGIGVREWIRQLTTVPRFAAFDTRASIPRLLSGAASQGIARELAQRGGVPFADSESFLVDSASALRDDELSRALIWGERLATALEQLKPVG